MAKSETIWTLGIHDYDIIHRNVSLRPNEDGTPLEPESETSCVLELKRHKPPSELLHRWDLKTPPRAVAGMHVAAETIKIITQKNLGGKGIARKTATIMADPVMIDDDIYCVTMERLMRQLFVVELAKNNRAFQWEYENAIQANAAYTVCRDILQAINTQHTV